MCLFFLLKKYACSILIYNWVITCVNVFIYFVKKFACSLLIYNWVITCINMFLSTCIFARRFQWTKDLLLVRTGHHAVPCRPRPHRHPRGHRILRHGHTTQMALIDHCCRVLRGTSQSTGRPASLGIIVRRILCL
jgi:hypothetical protein